MADAQAETQAETQAGTHAVTQAVTQALRVISSMATRRLLSQLADDYATQTGRQVEVLSVGGVDAQRRVAEGEAFDVVMLANDALGRLGEAGRIDTASVVDVVRSGIAVAVKAGSTHPAIGTEAALREAVLASRSLGYSTGPSGTHLEKLFAAWGIADTVADRMVQARPGVPVASLVASGEVEIGFQQLSELLGQPGIEILGPLPGSAQLVTTFSGAICTVSARASEARDWLRFLASPACTAAKQACGMEPG